jgi:hypothetical protein
MARLNIFGEISKLRGVINNWIVQGTFSGGYQLDTTKMDDYALTKELYYNTNDKYKLGAGFAKPVINTTVGFCGLPSIITEDENAQSDIDSYMSKWSGLFLIAQLDSLRDGDSYVRFMKIKNDLKLFKGEETSLQAFLISPESVTIIPDPITGEAEKYIIQTLIDYNDEDNKHYDFTVVESITKDKRTVTYTGDVPADKTNIDEENTWGFIPIIHFKNAAEPNEFHGRSELEVIEPFMKAYHDVFLQAMQSNKLNSNPKIKLKLSDVDAFLEHNFGKEKVAEVKQTGKLDFNKDLYLLNINEDMGFVEVSSATGDAKVLLELLFYCIVDASQVPEFAFGTAVQSSKASVSEQLVPLEKKIGMKRKELETIYQRLVRVLLAMIDINDAEGFTTYASSCEWQDVSPTDEEATANVLNITVQALAAAVGALILSQEAATEFLADFITTMHPFESDDAELVSEKNRIIAGQLLAQQLQNGTFSDLQKQQAIIDAQKAADQGAVPAPNQGATNK